LFDLIDFSIDEKFVLVLGASVFDDDELMWGRFVVAEVLAEAVEDDLVEVGLVASFGSQQVVGVKRGKLLVCVAAVGKHVRISIEGISIALDAYQDQSRTS